MKARPDFSPRILLTAAVVVVSASVFALTAATRGNINSTDGHAYLNLADRLLAGEGYQGFYFPPGYPVFLAACRFLFGPWVEYGCIALQYLLLLGSAWLVWRMPQDQQRLGLLAFAAVLVSPHLVNQASQIRCEVPCLACVAAGAYLLTRKPASFGRLFGAGLALGLACLVRNTSLGIVAGVALWLLVWGPRAEPLARRSRHLAVFVGAVLLAVVPWSAYASYQLGRLVPIAANEINLGWHEPGDGEQEEGAIAGRPLQSRWHVACAEFFYWRAWSLCYYWNPWQSIDTVQPAWKRPAVIASVIWMTPGYLLALALLLRRRIQDRAVVLAVVVPLIYILALSVPYVQLRYRYPVDPLIALAAVYGWMAAGRWLRRKLTASEPVRRLADERPSPPRPQPVAVLEPA